MKFITIIVILFVIYTILLGPLAIIIGQASAPLQDLGAWKGPLVFACLFGIAATLMVPSSLMKLTAGAMFGFTGGLMAGWLGAWLGAMIPFLIVRKLGVSKARSWIDSKPLWKAFDSVAEEEGLTLTVLIRLSLVIPYNFVNWVIGATRIRTRDYAIGNVATVFPTILYAWWGAKLGDIVVVLDGGGPERDSMWWISILVSLIITIWGIVWIDKKARSRLETIIGVENMS